MPSTGIASPVSNYYNKDKVRRSLGHFVLGKAGGAVVGLLTLLLMVRVLSVADYGLYVALVGYLEVFNVLSSFGLNALSERLVPEARNSGDEARLRKLIGRLVWMRAALVLVCCLAAGLFIATVGPQLGLAQHVQALLIFQLVVGFETLARYIESIFDSMLLQGRAQLSLISRTAMRLACLVSVWFTSGGMELTEWLWLEALAYGTGLAITLALLAKTLIALPKCADARTMMSTSVRASFQIYISQALGALVSIDVVKILVLRLASAEAAGVFGFCASLAWMVQRYLPSYLLVGMLRPLIVAAVVAGPSGAERLRVMTSIMLKVNSLLIGGLAVLVAVAGNQIVEAMTGGKFSDAGPLFLVMLVFVWTNSIRAILGHVALAYGQGAIMISAQLMAAMVLLLSILGISGQFGILGFGLSLVLMNLSWVLFAGIQMSRREQFPVVIEARLLNSLLFGAISAIFGRLLAVSLNMGPGATIVVAALAALSAYLILSIAFRSFSTKERDMINGILPRRVFIF